jgi:hypothetical protein
LFDLSKIVTDLNIPVRISFVSNGKECGELYLKFSSLEKG